MQQKPSIYISKNLDDVEPLATFCKNNHWKLTAVSGIQFELILDTIIPSGSVYFFGSKNAFHFFQKLDIPLENKEIAVIGSATKNYVETNNLSVSFYSNKAGNPEEVAQDFSTWLGQKKVTFFLSNQSKRSLAKFIPKEQYEEFIIYKTLENSQHFTDSFTHYIFTSPSNVVSFLRNNTLPENSTVISWGNTTSEALISHGIIPKFTLQQATQEELIEILEKI